MLEALHAHGAYDLRLLDYLPPTIADRAPAPGDEDLTLFACRRITFEWVLRREVLARPRVRWRCGVEVEGLAAEHDPASGLPRVTGARVRSETGVETWDADVVVDAGGRRSGIVSWLGAVGAGPVEEESGECGIFYCSRFYRLRPGAAPPANQGVVGADLGYMKFGIFPGDGGIFSITLAAPGRPVDPKVFLRSVLRDGLVPALRTDVTVVRGFMRVFNLLAPPDALITDPDLLGRVLAAWRERDRRPPPPAAGPERDEMLELIGRAA